MAHEPVPAPRKVDLEGDPVRIEVHACLPLPLQLAQAIRWSLTRTEGVLPERCDPPRPLVITRRGVRLDPEKVSRYRDLCGYEPGTSVPSAAGEVLFHDLLTRLALAPAFPFPPLGLVHLRQVLFLRSPLPAGEPLDLTCALAEMRLTNQGYECDCTMTVRRGGEIPWEGRATLLSRSPRTRSRPRSQRRRHPDRTGPEGIVVHVPADLGRRYAALSGDHNPIHLWPLTARAFGFPRPIAHGMWTLSRALAEVERCGLLPEKHRVEATFRRPLFLPGNAVLVTEEPTPGTGVTFEVRHPERPIPHVRGTVTPLVRTAEE